MSCFKELGQVTGALSVTEVEGIMRLRECCESRSSVQKTEGKSNNEADMGVAEWLLARLARRGLFEQVIFRFEIRITSRGKNKCKVLVTACERERERRFVQLMSKRGIGGRQDWRTQQEENFMDHNRKDFL